MTSATKATSVTIRLIKRFLQKSLTISLFKCQTSDFTVSVVTTYILLLYALTQPGFGFLNII